MQLVYTVFGDVLFVYAYCPRDLTGDDRNMSAGLADHMTMSGSAEQLALELAEEIAQVGSRM